MKTKVFNLILIMFCLYLVGCQSASQRVYDGVQVAKDSLDRRTAFQRRSFEANFNSRRYRSKDSISSLRLKSVYSSVMSATLLLDSTRKVLDKFDPNELNWVQVNLMGAVGDSLYNKIIHALQTAADFAEKPTQKQAIDSIYSNLFTRVDSRSWKTEYFGQTSVFGASMIIYGIGIEIYNAAQISIQE